MPLERCEDLYLNLDIITSVDSESRPPSGVSCFFSLTLQIIVTLEKTLRQLQGHTWTKQPAGTGPHRLQLVLTEAMIKPTNNQEDQGRSLEVEFEG